MRKIQGCLNCGEQREIAAHGLCSTCYRRAERAAERAEVRRFTGVDRHNPAIRKEHKKLFRGFTSVMTGLGDLSASAAIVHEVRALIDPLVAPIAAFLASPHQEIAEGLASPDQEINPVTSEQVAETAFTVHKTGALQTAAAASSGARPRS